MLLKRRVVTMGTVVSIHLDPGDAAPADVYLALARARATLLRADAVFSTWKAESPMSRLRRGAVGIDDVPSDIATVLEQCAELRDASGGWFDPWTMPGGVDPTGMVKGWAAQKALCLLTDAGAAGVMIGAGGDIAVAGEPRPGAAWRIGIQDPSNPAAIAGIVEPTSAIATSGCYERGPHVLDPHTGLPRRQAVSATVTGPDLGTADGLATGLVAGGAAALRHVEDLDGYEALLIGDDGSVMQTRLFRYAESAPPARAP